MSFAIEKISKAFVNLTPQEKMEFLKRIVTAPPGEWVELDDKIHFIPEGKPATEEEEESIKRVEAEFDAGQGVSLGELQKRCKI